MNLDKQLIINSSIYAPRLIIFFLFLAFSHTALAQSDWEINTLRNINPQSPDNIVWKGLSYSAEPIAVAIPAGMFATALFTHDKKLKNQSLQVLGSLAIATATTQILKRVIHKPRPYETYSEVYPNKIESGKSFPSGHTTTAFSTAMSLTMITKKWYVAVPAFTWAASVGYSRLYLGQHYPSDVIMGAFVGTASGFLSDWLTKKILTRKKKIFKNGIK